MLQSLGAAVSPSGAGESEPLKRTFQSKHDVCKKHVLLDDGSGRDASIRATNNDLPAAFKKKKGCQYSCLHVSCWDLQRFPGFFLGGHWALSWRGDELVLTSLFPCLIFYQTVLQTRFVTLPLCIGKRHPLPLSPAGSTPPNSRQAFQFLKNTFIQQSAGTGTVR